MLQRGIAINEIKDCVEFPDYKITKNNKIEMFKKLNNKVLRLICVQENKFIKVITLMWK